MILTKHVCCNMLVSYRSSIFHIHVYMYSIIPSLAISLYPISFPWPPSRSVASADQTSLDRSERASLDSKASTEASVASGENAPGEVAIGNLIDIEGNLY